MSNLQLSKNLLTLRKLNHMTQDELGEILSISRQAYSNYETGKRTPDLDTLMTLAQLYHISLDELVTQPVGRRIAEGTVPYRLAMDIVSADTLYLTADETELLTNYRASSDEQRALVSGFLKPLA
ncbi:helix-turn-helix transcriptional regulator [Hespellia stercorisuis]|uniref:DNA-binding transcriptional regulator, XRE-family HTH domain n=1 Tax=Hespellia stercorisuis DSM 15480 TaxID=1121950 RepID=A0A1M6SBF3_9FIRM|nr:helix-turn-helix transcriptional regulator [Hespellia stercorisuis]SHK42035.1 DNA-binding transcriptional regulator, XRE-family HTH domain [Hespellia stercorisuis DSM 15480]